MAQTGSKPWFSKNDPSPVVVHKWMNIAHFEPHLSRSSHFPFSFVVEVSELMFLPPPARFQYSILVKVREGCVCGRALCVVCGELQGFKKMPTAH